MILTPFKNQEIISVFDKYPNPVHDKLMHLREMIFTVAKQTEGVGDIEETLKWGQASYLTLASKSGSTIRIDNHKTKAYAMYFNCQTTLVETFRERYPTLCYEGNRAIVFSIEDEVPQQIVMDCIRMALTYHSRKKRK